MALHDHTYAVIMAGGVGSRFWPMSRSGRPKQFLDILDRGRTLIQMTADRLEPMLPYDRMYVVTNVRYKQDVMAQLPDLPEDQILCEPFMRNTAPCLAYAHHRIAQKDPHATIVVASADHLIEDEAGFRDVLGVAVKQASETAQLLTLGITPTRPDTGYGYIQYDELPGAFDDRLQQVRTFTEKPNRELAEKFIASGEFCWNSGIFIWSLDSIQHQFSEQLPDLHALFVERAADLGTDREEEAILAIFGAAENISIDYGIMEGAPNVGVVLGDFGWSDLGTWGSLYEKLEKDADGNALSGVTFMGEDAKGLMVAAEGGKLVVAKGLQDFIVVDTPDALLLCPRSEEQWVKQLVSRLKTDHGEPLV
jgi:mannose-1-phosphate guanylyltransferase